MRTGKRLVVLCCLLAIAIISAAVVFWPTPRRVALGRIEALDGTYKEQMDSEGTPRKLNCVVLASRPVTEPDLIALSDLRPLHRLLLDGCPLQDSWLVHLGMLDELEMLSLTGCPITDAGLVHLKGLKNLKSLSVRNTKVSDAGLIPIQQLTSLTFFNVAYSRVTERGVEDLKHALPGLKNIYFEDPPD
jgi:hypothetical protein